MMADVIAPLQSIGAARRGLPAMKVSASPKPETYRQQLFGVKGYAEEAPRQVEHPADDAKNQQALQNVCRQRNRRRRGGDLVRRRVRL